MGKTKLLASMVSAIEADAYRRGFNDGVRAAIKAVKNLRPTDHQQKPSASPSSNSFQTDEKPVQQFLGEMDSKVRRLRENSDQMRVLKAIRATPGMRGVEILRTLEAQGTSVHERTLRTALARLKYRNFIEQREERWFEKQAAVHSN